MSKKRRRERASAQSQSVEIFEDLAHEHAEIRLKATKKLLNSINDDQNPSHSEVETVVKRLIRGLCSARKSARSGYAVALTELLMQLWGPDATQGEKLQLSVSDILTLVEEQTETGSNFTTAETKDHYFGRIFAEEAIIKSKVLFQGRGGDQQWKRVLDVVLSLAKKKSWLRELCGWTLYQAIDIIKQQPNSKSFLKTITKRLPQDGFATTAEGVAIWLKVLHLDVDVKMPKGIWKKKNPLHSKEISRLTAVLNESLSTEKSTEEPKAFKSRGTWSMNVHFAWTEVVTYLLTQRRQQQQPEQEKAREILFEEFWAVAVDESLFGTSSSDERKYSGYVLFQQCVQKTSSDQTLPLFKENFLRSLTNHASSPDHNLYVIAQKSLSSILSKADIDPSSAPVLVEGLLRAVGHTKFDKLIRTKQVGKLITSIKTTALRTILDNLDRSILDPQLGDEGLAAARRTSIADALVATFRLRSVQKGWQPDEDSCEFRIFLILFIRASFESTSTLDNTQVIPRPPISADSHKMLAKKLNTCITAVLVQSKEPLKFFDGILAAVHALEAQHGNEMIKNLCSAIALSEIQKAQAHQTTSKNAEVEPTGSRFSKAFNLLFAVTIIQARLDDEDAVNLLRDLNEWAENLKLTGGSESFERLVEILLTIVSKPSLFGRKLVAHIFSDCTSSVTQAGLNTLFKVLDAAENLDGQTELFEGTDEVLENGVIQEGGSDVEAVDDGDASSLSEDFYKSSTEDVGDEDSDDPNELATLNAKLAEALGTRPGEEDVGAAESTGSDSDMDDEQMEALDATLEKVFRERVKTTKKKNEGKEAKQNVVLFKKHVLDLLSMYVKHEYSSGLCAEVILPLLHCLQKTRDKGIAERCLNLLRDYNKHYKLKDRLSNGSFVRLRTLFVQIHVEAAAHDAHFYQSACSIASQLVAKILLANAGSETNAVAKDITDIYARSQYSYLVDETSKFRPAFFSDWVNWMASNRQALQGLAPKTNGDHQA